MRKLIATIALTTACITGATVTPYRHYYRQPGSVSASRAYAPTVDLSRVAAWLRDRQQPITNR